ncbi:MAG: DUF5684 domain-containing protein [Bacilli bacterium]
MYDTSYATYGTSSNPAAIITSVFSSGISIIIGLGYTLLTIASLWKIFEKFGKEGWKSLIPIYNIIVLFEIAEMKAWYVALALIPCVGPFILMIFVIIAYAKIAKKLGKEGAFVLLIIFFTPIALALLAFGKNNEINNNNQNVQNNQMNNFNNMNNQNIMGTDEMSQQPVFNQPIAPVSPNNDQMAQPINNDFVSPTPAVDNQMNSQIITPNIETPVAPMAPEANNEAQPIIPVDSINPTVEQPVSEVTITEPVIEEQTPIAPPEEPISVQPVTEMEQPTITPVEPIQPVVEPVAPVAEPAVEPTPAEPVAPVAQTSVVETPATESTVDPLQNIEPPVIPTITDDNNNNIQ